MFDTEIQAETRIPIELAIKENLNELLEWFNRHQDLEPSLTLNLLDRIPESVDPKSYEIILKSVKLQDSEIINEWYINRAIEIDEYSGILEYSFKLLEIGFENGAKIKNTYEKVKTLYKIVYDKNKCIDIDLKEYLSYSDKEFVLKINQIDTLLSLEFILNNYSIILSYDYWDILKHLTLNCNEYFKCCSIAILFSNNTSTENILSILATLPSEIKKTTQPSIPKIDLSNPKYILKWDSNTINTFFSSLDLMVKQIDILQQYDQAFGVKEFLKIVDSCKLKTKFIVKFLRSKLTSFDDPSFPDSILKDLLYIHGIKPNSLSLLYEVEKDDILTEFIRVFLQNQDFLTAAKFLKNKSFDDETKKYQLISDSSQEFFDNSNDADISNGQLSLALRCLECVEENDLILKKKKFIFAAEILCNKINPSSSLMPIQLRLSRDPLLFIKEQLMTSNKSSYKNADLIFQLVENLSIDLEEVENRLKVYELIVLVTIYKKDYSFGYQIICDMLNYLQDTQPQLSKVYVDSKNKKALRLNDQLCKICKLLINESKFSDLDKRASIINFVLKICSPNYISEWISYHKELQLSNDLSSLKTLPGLLNLKYKLRQYFDHIKHINNLDVKEVDCLSIQNIAFEIIKSLFKFIKIDDIIKIQDCNIQLYNDPIFISIFDKNGKLTQDLEIFDRFRLNILNRYDRDPEISIQILMICDSILKSLISSLIRLGYSRYQRYEQNIYSYWIKISECIVKSSLDKQGYKSIMNLLSFSEIDAQKVLKNISKHPQYPSALLYYTSIKLWVQLFQNLDSSKDKNLIDILNLNAYSSLNSIGVFSTENKIDSNIVDHCKKYKNQVEDAIDSINKINKKDYIANVIQDVEFKFINEPINSEKLCNEESYARSIIFDEFRSTCAKNPDDLDDRFVKLMTLASALRLNLNDFSLKLFELYLQKNSKDVKIDQSLPSLSSFFDPSCKEQTEFFIDELYQKLNGRDKNNILLLIDFCHAYQSRLEPINDDKINQAEIRTLLIQTLSQNFVELDYKKLFSTFIGYLVDSSNDDSFNNNINESFASLFTVNYLIDFEPKIETLVKIRPYFNHEMNPPTDEISEVDMNKLVNKLYFLSLLNEVKEMFDKNKKIEVSNIEGFKTILQKMDSAMIKRFNDTMEAQYSESNFTTQTKTKILQWSIEVLKKQPDYVDYSNELKSKLNSIGFVSTLTEFEDPKTKNKIIKQPAPNIKEIESFRTWVLDMIANQNEPILIFKAIESFSTSSKLIETLDEWYKESYQSYFDGLKDQKNISLFLSELLEYFDDWPSKLKTGYKKIRKIHTELILEWITKLKNDPKEKLEMIPILVKNLDISDNTVLQNLINEFSVLLLQTQFKAKKTKEDSSMNLFSKCVDISGTEEEFKRLIQFLTITTHLETKASSQSSFMEAAPEEIKSSWVKLIVVLIHNEYFELVLLILHHFSYLQLFSAKDEEEIWSELDNLDNKDKFRIGLMFKTEKIIEIVMTELLNFINNCADLPNLSDILIKDVDFSKLSSSFQDRIYLLLDPIIHSALLLRVKFFEFNKENRYWFDIIIHGAFNQNLNYLNGNLETANKSKKHSKNSLRMERLIYKLIVEFEGRHLINYGYWILQNYFKIQGHGLFHRFLTVSNFLSHPPPQSLSKSSTKAPLASLLFCPIKPYPFDILPAKDGFYVEELDDSSLCLTIINGLFSNYLN